MLDRYNYEFWDVIGRIGWSGICREGLSRPYDVARSRLDSLFTGNMDEYRSGLSECLDKDGSRIFSDVEVENLCLVEFYHQDFERRCVMDELRRKAAGYREVLCDAIESYSLSKFGDRSAFPNNSGRLFVGSDDGFFDLTAHIVGCGKAAYYKALNDPSTIVEDYVDDEGRSTYVENFLYVFSKE